jgi:high-affinity nickel-transport protein
LRHATDPDHVVAVAAMVSRTRAVRSALRLGVLWGLGHTVTILAVGAAIVALGVVIPPRLGLGMELAVAVVLVVLGVLNVRDVVRGERTRPPRSPLAAFIVGVTHGLAGSAAVALLVLGAVRGLALSISYLAIFSAGTIAAMAGITVVMAAPVALASRKVTRFNEWLVLSTGVGSVAFGCFIGWEIVVGGGLFTAHPAWTPS